LSRSRCAYPETRSAPDAPGQAAAVRSSSVGGKGAGEDRDQGRRRGRMGFRLRPATGTAGGRDEPLALGGERDGVLYVPDTAEAGAPVMVFLHGATGSGRAHMRAVLGAVDRYGVILVAPDSRSGGTWDLIAERRFGPV